MPLSTPATLAPEITQGGHGRPRLRGVLHQYSFLAALAAGASLVIAAPAGRVRAAVTVYAVALAGLFGASALYHRVTWSPAARRWMRRLDHSMIFILIAGSYTPFVVVLTPSQSPSLLISVWLAALAAVAVKLVWIDGPKWVSVVLALALGWLILGGAPSLAFRAGPLPAALVVTGGVLYTLGSLAYAFRRPNLAPGVFGYHEVFHSLVCAAAGTHFTAIALIV